MSNEPGDWPTMLPSLRREVEAVPVGAEVVLWDGLTREAHLLDPMSGAIIVYFDGETSVDELVDDIVDVWTVSPDDARGAIEQLLGELLERSLIADD